MFALDKFRLFRAVCLFEISTLSQILLILSLFTCFEPLLLSSVSLVGDKIKVSNYRYGSMYRLVRINDFEMVATGATFEI